MISKKAGFIFSGLVVLVLLCFIFLKYFFSPEQTLLRVPSPQDSGTVYKARFKDPGYFVVDCPNKSSEIYSPAGESILSLPGVHFAPIPGGFAYVDTGGITLIDKNLAPVWNIPKLPAHHMISTDEEGNAFFPSWRFESRGRDTLRINSVAGVNKKGERIFFWEEVDHLKELGVFGLSSLQRSGPNDLYTHLYMNLNGVTIIPDNENSSRLPGFRKGNLLVSINDGYIFILDRMTGKMVFTFNTKEILKIGWIHTPQILKNGHILLFYNRAAHENKNRTSDDYSQVVEIDPISKTIVWDYSPHAPHDFYNHYLGSVYPTQNGNLLITDSNNGRLFEVTRDKKLAWEWFYPMRQENGFAQPVFYAKNYSFDLIKPFIEGR